MDQRPMTRRIDLIATAPHLTDPLARRVAVEVDEAGTVTVTRDDVSVLTLAAGTFDAQSVLSVLDFFLLDGSGETSASITATARST